MFDGDWLLAIAAYNAGEGNVLNAVKRNRRRGRPTDFWHLDLPRETETYVPRLLGLRDLVRSPEAHGISLPSIPNEPRIEAVKVDSQLDLALAADLAGISIERLYQLNPGYNRWATAPSGPHRIVLPVGRVDQFEQGLEATPTEKRVRWRRHKIARGETLIQIARRYHTTVKVIRDVNGIHGNTIRAGHHLVVPMASRPSDAYSLSKSQRLAALQGRSRSGQKHVHVVKRGDTLWGIARRYGVSVRTLGRWNRMAPGDTLRPGQRLVIWTKGGVTPVAAGSSVPGNRIQSVRYTVRSGDSLYRIAQRFNVKVSDLRRWNNIARGRYLQPGQKLRLKVDVTRQSGI
jgi:membrane-bound lytic murein transglycosylase D